MAANDIEQAILDLANERSHTAWDVIQSLCTGPQESQVRDAIWRLIGEKRIDLDVHLHIIPREV